MSRSSWAKQMDWWICNTVMDIVLQAWETLDNYVYDSFAYLFCALFTCGARVWPPSDSHSIHYQFPSFFTILDNSPSQLLSSHSRPHSSMIVYVSQPRRKTLHNSINSVVSRVSWKHNYIRDAKATPLGGRLIRSCLTFFLEPRDSVVHFRQGRLRCNTCDVAFRMPDDLNVL